MIGSIPDLTAVVVRALNKAIDCEPPDGCKDCARNNGLCADCKADFLEAEEYREARYLLTGQPASAAAEAQVA